ncbi:MAG: glycosyltransferase family protein, partial [Candidatus Glassbacteria bacterium]
MKLLMYSHDTFGLGHIRRTLLIADSLSEAFPDLYTLILTGSSMIHSLRIPPKTDYIKLPCLTKLSNGSYLPKYLKQYSNSIKTLRREIIFKTLNEYRPDFVLVDKAPVGVTGELLESLIYLKQKQPETRLILGIRDILDDPQQVKKEWAKHSVYEALDLLYDEIWVYGSKEINDVVEEYGLSRSVMKKVHFCGYLERKMPASDPEEIKRKLGVDDGQMVLVTLGGGGDGHDLIGTFIEAVSRLPVKENVHSLIITGPDFSDSKLLSLIHRQNGASGPILKDYTTSILDYMNAADLVVSMAGYNTVCEILSLGKKAIVVPRVQPRKEQLIRATKFSRMGLLKMIHPSDLSPDTLSEEMTTALSDNPVVTKAQGAFELGGLMKVRQRFTELRRMV